MLPKKKSRTGKWTVVIIVILLIAGALIYFTSTNDLEVYERIKAEKADITTYHSFSGNIGAKYRQTIISEMVMQVSNIYVQEGDLVEVGDVLLETSTGDEILAGIDGEVAGINIEENAMVMAGYKLMEIVDYNKLEINVRVDEYDISSLKKGKKATVKIGALNKELTGTISGISREGIVMNGLTFFTATIDLVSDKSLKVGMSAEVRLVNSTAKGAVTIPMSVVQFDDNNTPYILKENEKGKAVRTDIVTGINNGTRVEIKRGVANGETVLYKSADDTTGMNFRSRKPSGSRAGGGSD